ncbi:MAG TPA: tRNA (N(6)-L-threonylcarbamoyladenosine(37)-C(2))-methylthiotransferase MtaB [Spirochaetota bacterium]|nr:tRNA (N(6)-L-threonylcarbamoyladenosine(37)-C(2))-methylthiotransferase MtaB [Spirochaetota bacterium]HPJ35078.1 tRNA (N(6)-L-threonylcarbamoyladenosine(37)-C(2))-methylthiotransferase MtaB [Spirochaetota bacterium]
MKIKIESLGCRLNQSEIESVSTTLQNMGHVIVRSGEADIYIINSCAVTGRSERKARQLIYRAIEKTGGNDRGRIIVTGCATEPVKKDNNITYVSNDHKYLIPEIVRGGASGYEKMKAARFGFDAPLKCSTNRINLKIQDGCDNFCSYCIIPFMRGKPQSRSYNDIISEFSLLLENSYKEIILTGVNIGKYCDNGKDLGALIRGILELDGTFRLHLTSLDPDCAPDELLSLFSDPRMVRHLHLSLQSGSDTVLRRMNRPYTRADYLRAVNKLKSVDTDFNFTTDIIVGFPGESEEEFNDSVSLVREAGFSHIHTFRYSPRPGTRAESMDDAVPEIVKTERSREIISLHMEQKNLFYKRFSGRNGIFLSEKFRNGVTTGFNEYYVPVEVQQKLPRNEFFTVRTGYTEKSYKLRGELIS